MSQDDTTIWVDIEETEGRYQVSNTGLIRNVKSGLIRKLRPNKRGYMTVDYYIHGKRFYRKVHRLVAIAFIPNPKNLPQINHKHGDKNDNNAQQLEWCTQAFNNEHALETGLRTLPHGTDHWQSKLTDQQIFEIREKYKPREYTHARLAEEYGVSQALISLVMTGNSHKYLGFEKSGMVLPSHNTSGYRGVHWEKRHGR